MHQRVSFWLGMFVTCFLVWAWWDSMSYRVTAGMGSGGPERALIRQGGASYLLHGMTLNRGVRHERAAGDVKVLEESMERLKAAGVSHVKVRDEVVLAGWLAVWGGWMMWMRRREREGMKGEVVG